MKRIIVSIDPLGQLSINTEGYQGSDCLRATQTLERMLGRAQKRSRKSEYFQTSRVAPEQTLEQRAGQGA